MSDYAFEALALLYLDMKDHPSDQFLKGRYHSARSMYLLCRDNVNSMHLERLLFQRWQQHCCSHTEQTVQERREILDPSSGRVIEIILTFVCRNCQYRDTRTATLPHVKK